MSTYKERDAQRVIILMSNDAGVTWEPDPDGGGGAAPVTSVNGETGAVVLDAADVGADPAGTAAAAVVAHVALADPHTQYLKEADAATTYQPLSAALTTLASSSAFFLTLSDDADATAARATLGLVIGTNVQAWDADLDTISALSPSNDDFMQRKAGAWANRTLAQVRTDLFPAWSTYTPSVTQGGAAETLTTNDSRFIQIGKTMLGHVRVVFGSAGTANNVIFCTAPVASLYAGTGKNPQVGTGSYFDASTGEIYLLFVQFENASTNSFVFRPTIFGWDNVLLGDATLGAPTIASGDVLAFFFMYEIA